jgi:hypothetical protein
MDYQSGLREIQNNKDLTPETANELTKNLQELSKVRLQNLTDQFNPLTQAIVGAKDAFGTMFSDLIDGAKPVGDIFKDLIGNLGKMLSQMAGKRLSEELMGLVLGKDKKTAQAEAGKAHGGLGLSGSQGDFQGTLFATGQDFSKQILVAANDFRAIVTGGGDPGGFTKMQSVGSYIPGLNLNPAFAGIGMGTDFGMGRIDMTDDALGLSGGGASLTDGLVDAGSLAGANFAGGIKQAMAGLQSGASESAIMLADSGASAGRGIMAGIQGLSGAFDKFGKGDTAGGILGLLSTGLSLFGGGLFGGGGTPKIFADGNLSMLDGVMGAMQRERSVSGHTPKLAVVNDKEAILSAPQTKRFYALGLDKQVRNVKNYAAGNVSSSMTTPQTSGNTAVSVTIPVSVNGGGDRVDWSKAQSELAPQVEMMFANWVNKQKRDGGMLS